MGCYMWELTGSVASRPEVVGETGGQMPLLVRRLETAA